MKKPKKITTDVIQVQKDLESLSPVAPINDGITRILFVNDKAEAANYKRAKLKRFFIKGWQEFRYTTSKNINHQELVQTAKQHGCQYIEVDILTTKDQAKINDLIGKDKISLIQTTFPPDKPNVFLLIG